MADDNSEVLPLVSVLSEFESTFDHPESYLKPPATLQKDNLIVIKQIFDFCKKDELCGKRSLASTCPLQELLVENFDDEQIWQEIELQNTPLLRVLKQDIQSLKENGDKLSLLSGSGEVVKGLDLDHSKDEIVGENTNGSIKRALGSDAESDSNNEELSADENYDDQMDNNNDDDNVDDEEEEEGESANDDDINNASKKVKFSSNVNRKQKPPKKKSQVDDTFFKLSDMLQFLDKEDKKFERAHQKKSQKESDDDDDDDDDDNDDEIDSEPVDYFIDMDSDDAEEDEDEEWNKALGVTESLLGRKRKES
ncbi:u3 small nucleolar ribonucleoprotein MPP10 [Desmophyllum pertusum]|uniref:U3 small nucleolar ribonucleoprotein MPP10 n=1 Tax=Desmophyllum pertusum TaxID=174260 RepID=A0A9W9ZP32_9CNID|nr:u3 small nucleolar ribonucleoprotein MPP10 [Desmophyllum pertusum]